MLHATEIKVQVSYYRVKLFSKEKAQLLELKIKLGHFFKSNHGEDSDGE